MEEYLTPTNLSRRVFVKGVGLVSAALLLGTMGGCEQIAEAIKNRPMRRRLRTGSPEVDADIATYRQAVTLMKALPANDPRNWAKQAAIHGTAAAGFNLCQHGTEHFFSWHRAYLFYFEKICQKLTGNPHFGLPYWNWNQNPALNPAFLDTTSVMYLPRNNTTVAGFGPITTAELAPIFTDTNFFTFWPQIEGTPHNSVHSYIGATMGGGGSAMDPIFWTHHCMVDYCWYKWNVDQHNNNPNDPGWNGTAWDYFVDGDGNTAHMTAGITTIMPLLSYQYEHSNIGLNIKQVVATTKAEFTKLQDRVKAGANVKFDIKSRVPIATRTALSIARPFNATPRVTAGNFTAIIDNDEAKDKVFVSINYVQLPAESDFFVRVFINLPDANTSTPAEDPHYAGSFAFFGSTMPERGMAMSNMPAAHHHVPKFLVNITPTLQRLKKTQELNDKSQISVQLVAVPFMGKFEHPDTQLLLDNVELIVTPVIVNAKEE
ncbi:MAG TPA: tyrosinase family protein [Mucilaginibacter sp.]|nr:tyrosinase family protein [Mucilaginibacter sp.]